MLKKIIVILMLTSGFVNSYAQESWKFHTEKDGVRVYTKSLLTSRIKAIKVESILNASASQFVSVIMDIDKSTEWVYNTKSSVLVRQVSPSELFYYSEITLPWPAQNRDFIAHIAVAQNPATKMITIDAPCVSGWVPVKPGIVRVTQSQGKWIVSPLSKKHIKVEYTIAVDPGGSIPAWLVNLVASQGPLESFKMLKRQLQKPAYKNATLSYIVD
jgi:hypothetical protein